MLVSCAKRNWILWTHVGEFLTDFCRNSHICFSLKSVLSCFSINPKCPPPPAFPFWHFLTIKLVWAAVECFAQHSFLNFTELPPVKTLLWAVGLPPLFCKFLVLTLLLCGFLFNTLSPSFTVPRVPPRNIQVYNPTPNSLNVRWEPASGQVQQYRVAYAPLSGIRPLESVSDAQFCIFTFMHFRDTFMHK